MSQYTIELKDENCQKLDALARQTGKSRDELVNQAVASLAVPMNDDEQQKFLAWRNAAERVAGIWKDRDDLPDFAELRRSWDRGCADRGD